MDLVTERLVWDSEFFGFSVDRLRIPDTWSGRGEDIRNALLRSSARVVYVFVPVPSVRHDEIAGALAGMSGVLQDKRVTLRKEIKEVAGTVTEAGAREAKRLTEPVVELAFESGCCSRFARDEMLRPFCQPMYRKWIERDFAEGKVFVLPDEESPKGMVSVSVREGVGKIGLVAVRADCRGRGIGTALMRAVDFWLAARGVAICEVVTQGVNAAALALYRAAGFNDHFTEEVWHLWRPIK